MQLASMGRIKFCSGYSNLARSNGCRGYGRNIRRSGLCWDGNGSSTRGTPGFNCLDEVGRRSGWSSEVDIPNVFLSLAGPTEQTLERSPNDAGHLLCAAHKLNNVLKEPQPPIS